MKFNLMAINKIVAAAAILFVATSTSSKAQAFGAYGPAIGLDSGPEYLITFNGTSFTVQQDLAQGPYDGADDTYVAVVNTSLDQQLLSFNLSSNQPIFAFDGDGITLYSGYPSALGSDPTGYAPANVSFTATSYYSGTVHIAGGLNPGQSTIFSLEAGLNLVSGGDTISINGTPVTTTATPEPSAWALAAISLGLLGVLRRKAVVL